jgi:predicted DNA-binding transcriptional regulator AlpA
LIRPEFVTLLALVSGEEYLSVGETESMMELMSYNRAVAVLQQSEFRPHELAALLGVSESFLFGEVWKGRLVASKIGDDIVSFSRGDVLEWLSKRANAA